MKHCKSCSKPLVQRSGEWLSKFTMRNYCDRICRNEARRGIRTGGMPRGFKMPKKEVACAGGCGTILLRAHHWATATCKACEKKSRQNRQTKSYDKRREEARRYRILMALSPYDSWEELLEAVRVRQPRSYRTSYDLAIERRRAHG